MDIPYLNLEGPDCKYILISSLYLLLSEYGLKGITEKECWQDIFYLKMSSYFWLVEIA